MSRWRIAVVAGLITVPVLAWAGFGVYFLYTKGWAFYAWWPLMGMVALGYFLGWYWQRKRQLLKPPDFEVPPHWTTRDKEAYKLVEAKAREGEKLPPERLSEVGFYLQTAQELAKELAAFYHPGTTDPTDNLTVPEVLAVVELAAHDMGLLVDQHLPGGHLLTIRDWKRARTLQKWYETGSKIWWTVSALINPLQTGLRYAASQVGISAPLRLLQQNLFVWFYAAFMQRLGNYLIDLNSGRLRVGVARYRELLQRLKEEEERDESPLEKQAAGPFPADRPDEVGLVTITLVGQVKAGKSSLVNALLGEQRARTGVVPTTEGIDRYELFAPGVPTKLAIQDTVGYGHEGPRADQVKMTAEAMKSSDLVFLVLHARNPGRQADVEMMARLREWFAKRPDVKQPPVIAVLTHIDLLSPSLEWSPPYDWVGGNRQKEVNIREAVVTVREQFGDQLVSVVPVRASEGKVYGVDESLLPAVANWLDEVRGVALLRVLKAEADRDRMRRVFQQMLATGKVMAQRVVEMLTGSRK